AAMMRERVPTPLSLALLATVSGDGRHLVDPVRGAYAVLGPMTRDPMEALTVAVLTAIQRTYAIDAQLARIQALHRYLTRLAPTGMMVAAALLALLDGDEAGLLDDLRLASKAVSDQRLAPGGTEATSLAVKLLVGSALLARGSEGDPEESIALALRALP